VKTGRAERSRRITAARGVCAAAALAGLIAAVAPALAQEPSPPAAPAAATAPALPAAPGATAAQAIAVPLTSAQVQLLLQTLADAPSQGLESQDFSDAAVRRLADAAGSDEGRQALIAAVLRYARAVHVGQLPESGFIEDWGLRPPAYDPAPGFLAAVKAGKLKAWLDGLPPPYTGYETLREGLKTYRQIAERGGWTPIPAGPALRPGDQGERVSALRARLAAEDPTVSADGPAVYDEALATGVARAQKRFGLKDDGVAGPQTLDALNTPVQERLDQILANMERWRWLPAELPTDRIQVNIAAAILTVFHGDTPTLSMRAVTGRPGDETPMLRSQVESIVLNPPWNVPSSIATKELWPKEKAHPGYLKAHDFVVIPTDGGGTRLQQKAGDTSALGRIKFDFPNDFAVYLHDTPTKATFDRYARLASHGCVRLQKPFALAESLLADDPDWPPDRIQSTIDGGDTVRVKLPHPIAVFLLYWTAYVGPDGQVNFRDDPYGWDRELAQRLSGAPAEAS
jgi:murein L,D-transpeptidase YcbB/YkuD